MPGFIKHRFKYFVFIFVLLFCFALAVPKASAISISDMGSFCVEGNGSYTYKLQYSYSNYNFFVRNSFMPKEDVVIFFNSSKEPYRTFYSACSSANKSFMGNYSKKDGYFDLRTYDINYSLLESDIPLSGVLGDFSGFYVPLTNIWLANNNYILYNDSLTHTLQYIGNYKVRDYILWVDPLSSTMSDDTKDNFYLISIPKRKAWSMKIDSTILQDIFYGNIGSYDFKTFQYTNSYSLTQTTDTTIFPKQSNYMNNTRSYFDNDIGFNYIKDGSFIAPDFGDSSDLMTGYIVPDMTVWNNYQSCERETSFKNFIVNSWNLCRSDYSNGIQDYTGFRALNDFIIGGNIWNQNLTGELESYFSGITLSYGCQALLNNSISLVKLYNIIGKDPEYYFNVMNELKYITNDNPYNITQICGDRPAVPSEYWPVSNSSNVCSLDSWSNIINCFSFGSSESSTGSTYFTSTIDNVKSMVGSVFDSEFINPLIENYNSGFIYISNYSRSSCPVGYTSPFPSSMGDFIIYGFVALLGFVLFVIL